MTASAQICPDSAALFPKKVSSASGHYEYKSWAQDSKGERVARKFAGKEAWHNADLAANSYRNANGLETVFGIVFDFDAHRAKDCWKDAEGKLDWELILPALKKEIPEVANLICYAVRSTGGKGLGVVMAISPLPMLPSTAANQQSALKLQGRLLSVFDKMGFGADFGARGVSRDLPNFNNPDRLVYRNTQPLRELEKSSRPVVTELHKLLNARDRAARISERIYNDERVEAKLANLVLWLFGMMTFKGRTNLFLSGDECSATITELCEFTGASENFLRKFLKNPPRWLRSRFVSGEGWVLSIPLSKHVPGLFERLRYLSACTQSLGERVSFLPSDLCLPEFVNDGDRNAWIVRLALLYKWHRYSMDSAVEKVLLRVKFVPNHEFSRNCKNVRSIVRSLFRKPNEDVKIRNWAELPNWIRDDSFFIKPTTLISTRRGVTPMVVLSASVSALNCEGFLFPDSEIQANAENLETLRELCKNSMLPERCGAVAFPQNIPKIQKHKLLVIRRKQRIGIFDNGILLLCLTRKHYKASKVMEHLVVKIPSLHGKQLQFVSPRKDHQEEYFERVDNADIVHMAHHICGKRVSCRGSFENWKEKKGICEPPKPNSPDARFSEMQEIPF